MSKKPLSILDAYNQKLDEQFREIVMDVEDIQYKIFEADKKKRKKQKKKMKKGKLNFYDPRSKKARLAGASRLTGEKLFNGLLKIFQELKPLWVLLAKLVQMIIMSILSLTVVKERISTETLKKLEKLYTMCGGKLLPA